MSLYKVFCIYLLVSCINCKPQNDDQLLTDRIQNVFGTPNRGGFGEVVLPEPENLQPTTKPQVINNGSGQSCKCVPYWMCEPSNSPPSTTNTDSRFFGEIDVRFNPESCQDVLDVCCTPNRETKEVITPPPPPPKPQQVTGCGLRNVNGIDFSLTGNVNEAGFGEFPWTVAILTQNKQCLCGASLIHPSVVLTGAHCVFNLTERDLKVRAGEWDTQTLKERLPYQERNIKAVLVHQDFHSRTLANDIALLILDQPVVLDQHINVVCLPSQGYFSNSQSCFAAGWGKTAFGQEGKYSVIMKKVPLPMVPFHSCQDSLRRTRLGQRFNLHNSFVCAGGQENIDTCQGDGGSPLVCPVGAPKDNRYVQMGAVSWGIGCRDAIPGVYTNIALYRDWVDRNVQNYGFDPSTYSF